MRKLGPMLAPEYLGRMSNAPKAIEGNVSPSRNIEDQQCCSECKTRTWVKRSDYPESLPRRFSVRSDFQSYLKMHFSYQLRISQPPLRGIRSPTKPGPDGTVMGSCSGIALRGRTCGENILLSVVEQRGMTKMQKVLRCPHF
ncbi:hypothetical protein CH371_15550 [Leptospira wolffii]|uniref:Uncharacterized protein n=1 Tax=Leptospira wolffii TaxID=409998 RepID=A0A2M9Z912_9LEPT|nr:hypothetical protein CH371_15550 [Leptospira wolffii]